MSERAASITRRAMLAGLAVVGGCGWFSNESERALSDRALTEAIFDPRVAVQLAELETHFESNRVLYVPQARAWVIEIPPEIADVFASAADAFLVAAAQVGYLALFQKCPHLGCRVPECESSRLFECPCCGSKYTRFGERINGPAPRGLDRFMSTIEGDYLVIDTGTIVQGLPIGVHPSGETAMGPVCIGETEH